MAHRITSNALDMLIRTRSNPKLRIRNMFFANRNGLILNPKCRKSKFHFWNRHFQESEFSELKVECSENHRVSWVNIRMLWNARFSKFKPHFSEIWIFIFEILMLAILMFPDLKYDASEIRMFEVKLRPFGNSYCLIVNPYFQKSDCSRLKPNWSEIKRFGLCMFEFWMLHCGKLNVNMSNDVTQTSIRISYNGPIIWKLDRTHRSWGFKHLHIPVVWGQYLLWITTRLGCK